MNGPKRIVAAAILTVGALLATAGWASAGIIVQYTLTSTGAGGFAPTTTTPTVTATNILDDRLSHSLSALQNFSTGHSGTPSSFKGLNVSPAPTTFPTSVDDAFNKFDTFSFTVTPPPGHVLDLTSLTFNVESGGTANFPNPRATGVRSSLTDGTDLLLKTVLSPPSSPTIFPETLDLSSNPAFQHISGPVTFTFAVQTPNGNDTIIFNDVTLNGSLVAIPEPASIGAWLLFGTVGCWCLWRQRRLRRAAAV